MARRTHRSELPPDVAGIVEALRVCRHSMTEVQGKVRPFGPVYRAADAMLTAIDGLAELLTGDREHFWAKGSVGPDRAEQVRERQREVDG